MKRSTLLLAIGTLIVMTSGCAGYFQDRLKDASEILELGVGASKGFTLNVRATKAAQVGVGAYSGDWVGLREGSICSWKEERIEFGLTPFYYHEVFRKSERLVDIHHPMMWDPGYETFLNDFFLITDRGFFEVGATLNLIYVGVDVAVELAEAADFLTGLFGLDILDDDAYGVPTEELVKRLQSRSAWKRYAAVRALRRVAGRDADGNCIEFDYVLYTLPDEHTEAQFQCWRLWKAWLEESGQH
jgi:hypothetical protein